MRPVVSVIIPVYNTESYLAQCLDSILGQSLTNIEIICIDDCSQDHSLQILTDYAKRDNRIRIRKLDHSGAGAARNIGIDMAIGKYLYFMDSDDICKHDLLQKVVACAEANSADIVVFNYYRYDNETKKSEPKQGLVKSKLPHNKLFFSHSDIPNDICNIVNPTPWNKLFLSTFIKREKLYFQELPTTNDITFATVSVAIAKKIVYLDDELLYYRVNTDGSITSRKRKNLDNVISAVLAVDRQLHKYPFYNQIRDSIRMFILNNLFVAQERYAGDENSAYYVEFAKQVDALLLSYPLFIGIKYDDVKNEKMYARIIQCQKRASGRNDYSFTPPIIVSLTSFPARIQTVHIAIRSLILQTKQPDKIILWLAKSEFPNGEADLPAILLGYKNIGLEIEWCEENIRPHKKYYYAMQKYPDAIIVTVDDDLIYDQHMLELLFWSYMRFPYAVSSMRTHYIVSDEEDNIASYSKWIKEYSGLVGIPSMRLFATSGAGTLFPPYCMSPELFNLQSIKSLCIDADDLWLKIMQVLVGTPVVLVAPNRPLHCISGTQEIALRKKNLILEQNDTQLHRILNSYDGRLVTSKVFRTTEAISDIEKQNDMLYPEFQNISQLKQQIDILESEICLLRKSWQYQIGNIITYFPVKAYRGIKCYRENGIRYTVMLLKKKLFSLRKKYFK